jgi:hypothetical protein
MSGRDAVGADPMGRGAQSGPASFARTRLQIAPPSDHDARPCEGDIECSSKRLGGVELDGAFGAETVIDPVGEQAECALGPQPSEHVEEGHRVGTAAHRDEHPSPRRYQSVGAQGGSNEGDERGRV